MVSVSLRASNQESSELPTRDRSTDLRISRFDALSRRDRKLLVQCRERLFLRFLGKYKQIFSVWPKKLSLVHILIASTSSKEMC